MIRYFIFFLVNGFFVLSAFAEDHIEVRQGTVAERRTDVKSFEAWNAPSDPYYVLINQADDVVTLRPSDTVKTEDLQKLMEKTVKLKGFYTEGTTYQPHHPMESYPIEQQPIEQKPTESLQQDAPFSKSQPAKRGSGFVVLEVLSVQSPTLK